MLRISFPFPEKLYDISTVKRIGFPYFYLILQCDTCVKGDLAQFTIDTELMIAKDVNWKLYFIIIKFYVYSLLLKWYYWMPLSLKKITVSTTGNWNFCEPLSCMPITSYFIIQASWERAQGQKQVPGKKGEDSGTAQDGHVTKATGVTTAQSSLPKSIVKVKLFIKVIIEVTVKVILSSQKEEKRCHQAEEEVEGKAGARGEIQA